jgi:hypothetical protein
MYCAAAALAVLGLAAPGTAAATPEASVGGLLDFALAPANTAVELNKLNMGGTAFDPYRLRLFVDGSASDVVSVNAQLLFSDVGSVNIYGAYATISPWAGRDLHFQAGKIPWPIGTYGPRTYSNENPVMGTPLLYQYHTTLRADQPAASADDLLAQAGQGQFGVQYESYGSAMRGLPIVYDACWDAGFTFVGSTRPFEFSAGVTNGTPSKPRSGLDDNDGKSLMGRAGLTPHPGVRLGFSGSYGPYVSDDAEDSLPPGAVADDYHQILGMADLEWLFSRVELRAEGVISTWETPYVGDLTVSGYYVEGKWAFPIGLYAAARWDQLFYSDVTDSAGFTRPWDDDVDRFEGGVGFRIERRVLAKAIYQVNWLAGYGAQQDRRYDLVAGQLSIGF